MNRATFVSRLTTATHSSEIIQLLQDFTEENGGVADSEGQSTNLDTVLMDFNSLEGDEILGLPVRIKMTLKTTYIHRGGTILTLPTEYFCTFFLILDEMHQQWHKIALDYLAKAGDSFLSTAERMMTENHAKGLFSKN